jgi:hypothetical protein
MNAAEQEIDDWFKAEYHKLQDQHGRYHVPREAEQELSEEYKRRHVVLIDKRNNAAKQAAKEARAEETNRVCEVCLEVLPIKRGRIPKRCEKHK